MSDLFHVLVESQSARSVRLRLRIVHRDEITFPLSPSFARMLLEDESCEGYEEYERWRRARSDEDEYFDSLSHLEAIRLIEVRGLPREQGEPPAGLTWDDVDASEDEGILGEALYEIVVDIDGMLSHLTPGTEWESTAYDEAGDGPLYLGRPEDPKGWSRDA